jgi:hypothetical protein
MNPRLTHEQIHEILAGAERVDVPPADLVAAAAEIRATLLAASDDAAFFLARPTRQHRPTTRRVDSMRRARTVRIAAVAAALMVALTLSGAAGGALPDQIQGPVARAADFFGLDLPRPDPAPPVDTSSGVQELTANRSSTSGSDGSPNRTASNDPQTDAEASGKGKPAPTTTTTTTTRPGNSGHVTTTTTTTTVKPGNNPSEKPGSKGA